MDHEMMKDTPLHMEYTNNGHWGEPQEYHASHVQSPAHEYGSYGFASHNGISNHQVAMDNYARSQQPMYSAASAPHSVYPAQWPSVLASSSAASLPPPPAPPPPHQPPHTQAQTHVPGQPPVLAPTPTYAPLRALPPLKTTGHSHNPNARRTLTDQDRRRMCKYHEEHPTIKQTEIGAMFGVERSTVSKVLRNKEKYLAMPETDEKDKDKDKQKAAKKAKGKSPNIERTLSNWARNQQRRGLALSDQDIREKAKFFAMTVVSQKSFERLNSTSWLEKFKQKNNLNGGDLRTGSDANESDAGAVNAIRSQSQTPNGVSPISPDGVASPVSPVQSRNQQKPGSPDSYVGLSPDQYRHNHSQSTTSLTSGQTDTTAPSSYSAGPQSPTLSSFSSEITGTAAQYPASQAMTTPSSATSNLHPSRSQTFPVIGIRTAFESGNGEKLMSATGLRTPADEYPDRQYSISSDMPHMSQPPSNTQSPILNSSPSMMAPPPNPMYAASANNSAVSSPIGSPSQDEARRALELVMNFFQAQPTGVVDPQEYITMGKLMEKLKVQGSVGELPGGMHSIDVGHKEVPRKRSIHSL